MPEAPPTIWPRSAPKGLVELLRNTASDVQTLLAKVVELAKLELTPQGKTVGIAVGLLVGAAIVALTALGLLLLGCSVLIGMALGHVWLGFLIMAAFLLLLTGLLAWCGIAMARQIDLSAPRTKRAAAASVAAVKGAIDRASTAAQTPALERHRD